MRSYPFYVVSLFLFSLYVTITPGCTRPSAAPPNNSTSSIATLVQTSNNLTMLNKAMVRANLNVTLSNAGPYTLFAPTDASFASSGIDSAYINRLSDSALSTILLYHIIDSAIASYYLPAGPNGKLITASGDSLFVTIHATGIYINGIPITQADVLATNGYIDAIRFVLLPPTGNIMKIVQTDTTFSYLAAAILRASNGSTEVASILSIGIYSLLAPTNSAFQAAGYPTINDINNANPDTLAKILTYHILKGRLFSSDLALGGNANTVNGETVTIYPGTSISVVLKGNGNNGGLSNITKANIMARNGVIHVIDKMLLP